MSASRSKSFTNKYLNTYRPCSSFPASAILNCYAENRCALVPRLPFPVPRSPFPVPRSPFPLLVTSPPSRRLIKPQVALEAPFFRRHSCLDSPVRNFRIFLRSSSFDLPFRKDVFSFQRREIGVLNIQASSARPFLIHCCSCKGCSAFLHPLER